jgi:hypothetical protein
MKMLLIALCLLIFVSSACKRSTSSQINRMSDSVMASHLPEQVEPQDSTALTIDSLLSARVYDTYLGWVRLKNGEYSIDVADSIKGYLYLFRQIVNVDLDSDGYKDAITSLSANYGGSGGFNSLDIFLNRHGSAVHAASYSIGDREGIDSITVVGDTLHVFLLVHGPNDAMCCPTEHREWRLRFSGERIFQAK